MPPGLPRRVALVALGALVTAAAVAAAVTRRARAPTADAGRPPQAATRDGYVGAPACAACHRRAERLWRDSHHARAMAVATRETVRGNVDGATFEAFGATTSFRREGDRVVVRAEGPDGRPTDYPATHTFGVWPLQQLLVPFPGGRLQALDVCWDTRPAAAGGARWFRLRPEEGPLPPGDALHWTGRLQTWNSMCAECHSTALRKGYDPATDTFSTTWSEIAVSCEACHGPGERHVAWARAKEAGGADDALERAWGPRKGLTVLLKDPAPAAWNLDWKDGIWKRTPVERSRTEVETCARCHARRSAIADTEPGAPFLDGYRPALLEEGLYFADGQVLEEVFEHASFLQSRMYAKGITCADCHERHRSHAATEGASKACSNCHLNERFRTPAHHHHGPTSAGASCVACHMPTRTYMAVHARRDHSIRVPRPDLSVELGTPNACDACHADKGLPWQAEAYARWWGDPRGRLPTWGPDLHAGREGAPGAETRLVARVRDRATPAVVRATAASLLARYGGLSSATALREAAGEPDDLVRFGAAQGGAGLDAAARWAALDALLDDPRLAVRIEAARTLAAARDAAPTPPRRARLEAALLEFRQAQEHAAEWPEAHGNLAALALDLGDAATAERELRRAVALDPAHGPSRVNLADVLRAAGRDEEGERVLRDGIARSPRDAAVHHALGLLLVRRQRAAEALTHLEKAAALAPDDARFAWVHAVALASTGQPAAARRALDALLARHPWHDGALASLVEVSLRLDDRGAARRALDRLAALRPADDPEVAALRRALETVR